VWIEVGMNLEGHYQVKAAREKTWEFITDPNKIGKCFPDLKSIQVQDGNKFTAVVRVGIGVLKGDFKFQITILDQVPPAHARLKGTGVGVGSNVAMDTSIDLAEAEGGTTLTYKANVQIGGTLASVGQRVIGSTVEKTVAEVFSCVRRQLES